MIQTSALYKQLFNAGAIQEYKIEIGSKTYNDSDIYDSATVSQRLFDKPTFTVGSFAISTLKMKLRIGTTEIPINAPIKFYYRYTNGTQNSEWIKKFDGKISRRTEFSPDITTIEAKDKAANYDIFMDHFPTSITTYPANARTVATLCATHLGLVIENLTDVFNGNAVEYPNEMTVVEVLKNIAKLSGGNWTVTENDKLKMVVLRNDNLIPCPKTLSCFTASAGYVVTNTPTYTFTEIQNGQSPSGFVGESPYRRIQIDFGQVPSYPSEYLYPSLSLYPQGGN